MQITEHANPIQLLAKMAMIFFLALSLLLQGALGELVCEELPVGMCSFSIAFSGKRCSLETGDRAGVFQCKTSEVLVHNVGEHIETDECINACGADRNVIGISSDSLLDTRFTAKLCSKQCFNNCPNIVDLYSNLALAEGGYLPAMCQALEAGPGRAISQLKSSGVAAAPVSVAAAGPISNAAVSPISGEAASGPAQSPVGSDYASSAPAPL